MITKIENASSVPAGYTEYDNYVIVGGKLYKQVSGGDVLENLFTIWSAGTYNAGFMVQEGSSPVYFYLCVKNGTVTEPALDYWDYNASVPFNPGASGWVRFVKLSYWSQYIYLNYYGPSI